MRNSKLTIGLILFPSRFSLAFARRRSSMDSVVCAVQRIASLQQTVCDELGASKRSPLMPLFTLLFRLLSAFGE